MTLHSSLLTTLCGALLLALAGCGPSTQEFGMCTYMGVCPEDAGCKDGQGTRDEDGSDCSEPKKPAIRPSHSTGEMGGGDE